VHTDPERALPLLEAVIHGGAVGAGRSASAPFPAPLEPR
jgi:hypothetical protein